MELDAGCVSLRPLVNIKGASGRDDVGSDPSVLTAFILPTSELAPRRDGAG